MKRNLDDLHLLATLKNGVCLSNNYLGMNKKHLWQCHLGHRWEARPENIVWLDRWCPYCAGNAKCTIEEIKDTAAKLGFECLSDSYYGNQKHLEWKCSKGHIWKCTPKNIKKGRGCPYCANHILPAISDVQKLAKDRGGRCLSLSMSKTSQKLEWECSVGHCWFANYNNVKSKNSWCPQCREFRNEKLCREIFEDIFKKPFPKLKNIFGTRLELDGYCKELNIAFEYNGEQHYKCIEGFKMTPDDLKKVQHRDAQKQELCDKNGVSLIVIPFTQSSRLRKFIPESIKSLKPGVLNA